MSAASYAVTYTSIYTDSEPWRKDSAETGPPRVYRYDGLPTQPVAPPSPDYVLGPEHPPSPDYVPGPKHLPSPIEIPYVPEPEYPEYLAPSDDEAPLEDQPLPADASPIAASPDYVADSDLEEDPEEDPRMIRLTILLMEGMVMMSPPMMMMMMMMILTMRIQRRSPLRRMTRRRRSTQLQPTPLLHAPLLSPPLLVPSLPLPLLSPLTISPNDTGAPLGYRAAGIRMRALLPSASRRTDIPEA
nr:hypothetical protein [Tanacetum cinerariifolium]